MPGALKLGFAPFAAPSKGVLVCVLRGGLKFGSAARKVLEPTGDLVAPGGGGRPVQGQEWLGARHRGAGRARRIASDRDRRRQGARPQGAGLREARRDRDGEDSRRRDRGDHHRRTAGRGHQAGAGRRYRARRRAARLCVRPLQDQAQGRRGEGRPRSRSRSRSRAPPLSRRHSRPRNAVARRRRDRARSRQRAGERALPGRIRPPRRQPEEARRRRRGARRQGDEEARHERAARRRAGLRARKPHGDHALERRQARHARRSPSSARACASIPAAFRSSPPPAWRT